MELSCWWSTLQVSIVPVTHGLSIINPPTFVCPFINPPNFEWPVYSRTFNDQPFNSRPFIQILNMLVTHGHPNINPPTVVLIRVTHVRTNVRTDVHSKLRGLMVAHRWILHYIDRKNRHRRINKQRHYECSTDDCHKSFIPVVTCLTPLASSWNSQGQRAEVSIDHAFTVRIRTKIKIKWSFNLLIDARFSSSPSSPKDAARIW